MNHIEVKECITRLQAPNQYVEGGISLYVDQTTFITSFMMDRSKKVVGCYARRDNELTKKPYPEKHFYDRLNAVSDFGFITLQDRIDQRLLTRNSKNPRSKTFAEDREFEALEAQRLSDLTLNHTVPILRFQLQWQKDGPTVTFAGALLKTHNDQIMFELANKG